MVKGCRRPRLWTRPLRPLTRENSYGYDVIDFAKEIGFPLDPWQEWLVIHIGELLADGRPRFRKVLVLVARQNGKTTLLAILALYWLFRAPKEQQIEVVLGTSTNREYARAAQKRAVYLAVDAGLDHYWRRAIGDETIEVGRKEYKIAASNAKGGRSMTVDRLIVDELREHDDWDAMEAAEPTMSARPFAQQFMISNQGGDHSVVLDSYRNEAMQYLETGEGDHRLGLFEWSAPNNADPEDVEALRQANPNLGLRIDLDDLRREARAAKAEGGARLAKFKTNYLCMRVHHLDPAIDPDAWEKVGRKNADEHWLDDVRDHLALCVDVSPDGRHATAAVAGLDGSETRLGLVGAWEGINASNQLRAELPGLVKKINPRIIGWFPSGGAAAIAADLKFPGYKIEPIRGDITVVCMAFSDLVVGGHVLHPDDPLLNKQVNSAERHWNGDRWMFIRRGASSVDAVYAAAGATHLARTLPPPEEPTFIVSA